MQRNRNSCAFSIPQCKLLASSVQRNPILVCCMEFSTNQGTQSSHAISTWNQLVLVANLHLEHKLCGVLHWRGKVRSRYCAVIWSKGMHSIVMQTEIQFVPR